MVLQKAAKKGHMTAELMADQREVLKAAMKAAMKDATGLMWEYTMESLMVG